MLSSCFRDELPPCGIACIFFFGMYLLLRYASPVRAIFEINIWLGRTLLFGVSEVFMAHQWAFHHLQKAKYIVVTLNSNLQKSIKEHRWIQVLTDYTSGGYKTVSTIRLNSLLNLFL